MKRRLLAPSVYAGLGAALMLATVSAQPAPWRLVQGPDGVAFVVRGDVKNKIVPAPITEADMLIPEGQVWADGWLADAPSEATEEASAASEPPVPSAPVGRPVPAPVEPREFTSLVPRPQPLPQAQPAPPTPAPPPPAPAPPVAAAPPPPAAPVAAAVTAGEEPVKVNGNLSVNTPPFQLRGGAYVVQWAATAKDRVFSGNVAVALKRTDGAYVRDGLLVNEIIDRQARSGKGETRIYNVEPGTYYLDVTAPGEWLVVFTPQ